MAVRERRTRQLADHKTRAGRGGRAQHLRPPAPGQPPDPSQDAVGGSGLRGNVALLWGCDLSCPSHQNQTDHARGRSDPVDPRAEGLRAQAPQPRHEDLELYLVQGLFCQEDG